MSKRKGLLFQTKTYKNLIRFLSYLKPYKAKGIQAAVCMGLSVLLRLPQPLILMFLIDDVFVARNWQMLNVLCIALLLFYIFGAFINFLQAYLLQSFRQKVMFDIQLDLFRHIESLPLSFFHNKETGYLVSRIRSDTSAAQGLLADTIINFTRDTLTFVVSLAILLLIHWKLTLISIAILPFFAYSLVSFSRKLRGMSKDVQESYANASKTMQESFSGIFIVKSFLMEIHEAQKFVRNLKELIRGRLKRNLFGASSGIAAGLIVGIAGLVVIWYGGSEIMRGHLTLGQFVAFNSFIGYLFGPTRRLVTLNVGIQTSLAAIDRIFELKDLEGEELKVKGIKKKIEGKVSFRNVTLSYDEKEPILSNVNFSVNPGEVIAIVGKSGVGKTTLVNLIPRFYEVKVGEIMIDGINVRDFDLQFLRQNISIVPQGAFLFSASVKDNIRFGKADAPDDEIIQAAKLAHAHEFISKLPYGYDTQIGERGVKISGGERQRLAIARAILKNPKILIFDEAMSELDLESEKLIQDALLKLSKNRTIFIIAHRLSTILNADRILVLANGSVVGDGTHNELYKDCEAYRKLYDTQLY